MKIKKLKFLKRINKGKLKVGLLIFALGLGLVFSFLYFKKTVILIAGGQKVYFVLLQNNFELRPSGGFMGSYAKVEFTNTKLKNIQVEDIYVPDGQLKGHVDPPWPIQEAFKQGWWRLRDSNWEPDFPLASGQISWFFQKSGEEKPDGLIAVNFLVAKELVKIFGPLDLPDYNLQINADNFYEITQQQVEKDFFPGSTQKKDFLSALNKQLIFKLKNANIYQYFQLAKVIKTGLREKQILLNFNNSKLQKFITKQNWDGGLRRKYRDKNRNISDYLYIVDTNLGTNKTDAYVERKAEQEIVFEKTSVKEKLKISYINSSPRERPNFKDFWGGPYKNFLRVFIPLEAENVQIKINDLDFKDRVETKEYKDKKIKSIGFFVEVPPLKETKVEIDYEKKFLRLPKKYYLEIQKQPGIESLPLRITILPKNKTLEKNLKTDEVIKIKI